MSRLDACAGREGKDGKTYWTKIGAAFPNKSGKGYMVVLDAMPAPIDGQFKISLFEPKPRENRDGGQGSGLGGGGNLDDEIPF